MQVLVINSGSSSIKFQLIQMPLEKVICKGLVDRIGQKNAKIQCEFDKHTYEEKMLLNTHEEGLAAITAFLLKPDTNIITQTDEISVVAHRVVHGGSQFGAPTIINQKVLTTIEDLSSLAPLHNPANATGIKVASKIFKNATQIAVFDTAFHNTLPAQEYRYAIPKTLSEKHQLRAYGFHGTSHKYVSQKAITYLKKPKSKIISVHLGNGCSITAIKDGKSIAHSLGFGPSNGLIMGTRSGDIDQSVIFHLINNLGFSAKKVNQMLQKESGLLGLTGFSDVRDILKASLHGNDDCSLALHMMAYRIKKYIGAYIAVLNGLDALIFTAGIGENSKEVRVMVCEAMEVFGIEIDTSKNNTRSQEILEIQKDHCTAKVLVIPTNEELEIALQSYNIMQKRQYNCK